MGEAVIAGFELREATVADLEDLVIVQMQAMSWDPILVELQRGRTFEDLVEFGKTLLQGKLTIGAELGACKTWKIVEINTG